jgi:non-specific serine/threonine protein kinase
MASPAAPSATALRFGRFELHAARRQLLLDGQPVVLGARAFDVLLALAQRRERIVTKEELLDLVWPGLVVEENNLAVQISSLRRIFGQGAIATIPGRGYQFTLDPARDVTEHPRPSTVPASPAAPNNNLPERVTSFIGRETDLATVKELLGRNRLVSLVGVGGVGKTRLGLEIAADSIDAFADGVWLIELASVADARSVPHELARVFHVREESGGEVLVPLVKALRDKKLLLLLDNCEHLLAACAGICDALLAACPQVRILATSREALRVAGEATFRVPSLAVPEPQAKIAVDSLMLYAGVRLFVDRAVAVSSSFKVEQRDGEAVASICSRLDGIPLAIELAAARIHSMSVHDISARLDERFRLLTRGARTALPRQQTLRAAIDWSYDLLSEPERALLRRLSVFSGGLTLLAAEEICGGIGADEPDVFDLVNALVDKSLLLREERLGTRYRFLETVQQYARDRLRNEEDESRWRARHLAHFLAMAEQAAAELRGQNQHTWLDRVQAEHDNVRAALTFASAPGGDPLSGLRLAVAISRFWSVRGYFTEGRSWYSTLLAAVPDGAADAIRATALNASGFLAWQQGDLASASRLNEQALAIGRALNDRNGIANSLSALGLVAKDQNQYERARRLQEESLSIHRELGNRSGVAVALANLATISGELGQFAAAQAGFAESSEVFRELGDKKNIAMSMHSVGHFAYQQGDYVTAQAHQEQSLAFWRELGDRRGVALALGNLGLTVAAQGDHHKARSLQEESLEMRRALGDRRGVAIALLDLGELFSGQGDRERARALYRESLSISRSIGDRLCVACALEGLAASLAEPTRAAILWGGAERLRHEISAPLPPRQRSTYSAQVDEARVASGDDVAFEAAWQKGAGMLLGQIIDYALQGDGR